MVGSYHAELIRLGRVERIVKCVVLGDDGMVAIPYFPGS